MNSEILAATIGDLRSNGAESTKVEVKSAVGGLPKSVAETLSAFSNGHGGVLILGLDEGKRFTPAPGFDPVRIQTALADMCADALLPPVRAEVDIFDYGGAKVVVADVPELPADLKPCYVRSKGEFSGSYIRGGEGDRKLTAYEIQLLHSNRGQPRDDQEPVPQATVDDLNATEVAALLERVRIRQPHAFAGVDDVSALRRLGVLASAGTPTVAGLLALGIYPQQFFPQLAASFVRLPGESVGVIPEGGARFLDNRLLDGPIPIIVSEAVVTATRSMSVRSYVNETGRVDRYEYPPEAIREAVVNALIHRDYSSLSRGSQVQIEMYVDRLVVRSPGGLFGPVTEADLGTEGVSSSRNALLARLLADVRVPHTGRVVCENRASGIPTMIAQLRDAGLPRPQFVDKLTHFTVTFSQPSGQATLAPASRERRQMRGQGRLARMSEGTDGSRGAVLAAFLDREQLSRQQVQELTGLGPAIAARYLSELVKSGDLVAIGSVHSPKRRYRRADGGDGDAS